MIKYVKVIIERNSNINWNNFAIDNSICEYTAEDLKFDNNISRILNQLPCVDDNWTMNMIIDIENNRVVNWDFDSNFKCAFKLDKKACYQFLDESEFLVRESNYKELPDELKKYEKNGYLYLNIDKEGNILN